VIAEIVSSKAQETEIYSMYLADGFKPSLHRQMEADNPE
jgi:hypothetical protein